MNVFYSPYTLTSKKKVNRLSPPGKTYGVYLKGVLKNKVFFADYYPHLPLGDRSVESFLDEFKYQEHLYDQKVFDLLLKDHSFQKLGPKIFFNHELWDGTKNPEAQVVKYKLLGLDDVRFLPLLSQGIRLRLDSNGLFSKEEYLYFLDEIPKNFYPLIDYIEDPLKTLDWEGLTLRTARDFIPGTPCDFFIYKPNCEFLPKTSLPVIYSSYLGGDLGKWHAYCELIGQGDLTLTHGIHTEGFYEEETSFFEGSYRDGFKANLSQVQKIYQNCSELPWKLLCSM